MQIRLNKLIHLLILILLIVITTGICAAETINLEKVGSFGSDREIEGVEVVGNYAYVLQLGDLVVLNVVDPTNPIEVNRIAPPPNTSFYGITKSDNYIYATISVHASDYSIGTNFRIYDITNPTTPKLVGQYSNQEYIRIIKVSNGYAYLLGDYLKYLILDVSNPGDPKLVGQYVLTDPITSLDVSGQYLYLTTSVDDEGSLIVIDISDPTAPKLVGQYNSNYRLNDVVVSGQYAYLANGINGLIILDISNPTLPTLVGKYIETGSNADQVVISGKYAYVIFDNNPIYIDRYYLSVVNISNPATPKLVNPDSSYGSYDGGSIGAVSGNYIYMIIEYGGLAILRADIQNQNILSYTPLYDNRLRDLSATTVLSTTTYLDVGKTSAICRDVMLFDLSKYKTTDTISKATLSLYWYYPAGATRTSDTVVEIYRPVEWDPKYVTWNSRMSGTSWTTAGGSWYDKNGVSQGATPYALLTFAGSKVPDNKYYDFDVTQLVQEYVSGKYKNTGFFIKAKTESGNYIAFYSSEYSNAAMKPKLTITSTSGATSTDAAPVANAGADKTVTTNYVVTFDASLSTDDKGIASYSWDFDSSNGITSEANTVSATKTYTTSGTYTVTLTVTDTIGQKSTDTLQVIVSAATTPASTVTYAPTYDNRIRESSPTTVLSTTTYIDIGKTTSSYRDVMMFDLSGYKTTDTISKATLSLYWYYPAGATRTSDTIVEIYRPVEWDPKYVTWNSRMSGISWTTAGGNWFDKNAIAQGSTPYASMTFAGSSMPDNKYYEFDVTQLVQEYISGKYKNTGFFLKAKTESGNYIAFYSSEYSNTAMRPKLTVATGASSVDNPPVANAGADKTATTNSVVTFDGSASTDDKGIASYSWDFDVSNGITSEATGVTATHTYASPGTYTVTLTVTDTSGKKATDTLKVIVSSSVDNAPVANAGADKTATTGSAVTFSGSASTDDKGIASYSWDFDVSNGITSEASGVTATHTYTGPGTYTVTLTVTDTAGQKATDTMKVVVSSSVDNPPVANAGADKTATVGSAVTFDASASTDDKGITSYSWDFDQSNGITADATTKTASKTYTAAGTYIVTLTVTDTSGQKSTDTLQVTVSNPVSSVSYAPLYDNRLRSDTPTTVLSTTTYLDIGRSSSTARDVMLFDLSSYKTTDTISKATLSLYWYYPAGKTRTTDTIVEVYRPVEWDPKYVTWNSRISGTSWSNAGGSWYDKNAIAQGTTPYASVTFAAGTVPGNKYYEFDVTQLVQEYVSGKYKNTGFFLKAKTESGNYIAFYSSEYSNTAMRPKLTITR